MALWFVNVLSLFLLQAISSVTCRLNSNKCPLFLLQASRNKHLYIFTWCSSPACWVRAPCCRSPPLFYLVRTSLSHSRQRRELFSGSGWLVVGFFFKRVKKRGPDSCGEDFWDAFLEKNQTTKLDLCRRKCPLRRSTWTRAAARASLGSALRARGCSPGPTPGWGDPRRHPQPRGPPSPGAHPLSWVEGVEAAVATGSYLLGQGEGPVRRRCSRWPGGALGRSPNKRRAALETRTCAPSW